MVFRSLKSKSGQNKTKNKNHDLLTTMQKRLSNMNATQLKRGERVNSGVPEGLEVPVPPMEPIVLLINATNIV